MKTKTAVLGTITLTLSLSAIGQTPTNAVNLTATTLKPPASAGLLNDWLRTQSDGFKRWDIGGQFRARYELHDNYAVAGRAGAVDFGGSAVDNDNDYFLTRTKIHIGYSPADWFTAFVEGRHSTASGDERNPSPDRDTADLHQAYLKFGDAKKFPVALKVGRQELAYGDERLVGALDWGNVGRVFDAVKLRYENPDVWVDAFVSHVVMVWDDHFNKENYADFFSGIYASTKTLIPKQETQIYFLARNVSSGSPTILGAGQTALLTGASPRDIYTFGFRVKSLPGQFHGWDYEGELAGQLGDFKATAASPSLDQRAFAAHVAGGYTWEKSWGAPHVGLEYNFASGDGNSTDGTHGTFDNLFPTNHKFYGFMDFVSLQNIHNARLATSLKPSSKLTLTADYHAFWLADTHDNFYQVNGAPRTTGGYGINSGAGSFVGTELDLVATYAIKPYATMQAGYGHFFVGDYVKNSLAASGGSKDANFFYAQMTFNF